MSVNKHSKWTLSRADDDSLTSHHKPEDSSITVTLGRVLGAWPQPCSSKSPVCSYRRPRLGQPKLASSCHSQEFDGAWRRVPELPCDAVSCPWLLPALQPADGFTCGQTPGALADCRSIWRGLVLVWREESAAKLLWKLCWVPGHHTGWLNIGRESVPFFPW